MELGEHIIKYRANNKMTQKELSELVGLSQNTISYLENGWTEKCSVAKLALLIKLLNLTPEETYNILMNVIENKNGECNC